MDWSPQQAEVLKRLGRWLDEPLTDAGDQVRYLGGYAGTGKTTLAKHLAEQCSGKVLFAAYTGKAAFVMRQKGCIEATTIHSLIYKPAGESKSDALREVEMKLLNLGQEPTELAQRARWEIERNALVALQTHLLQNEERRPMFRLNLNSALCAAQALILDECSMVDDVIGSHLESFGVKILALGDPAQLPPVGAGGRYTKREPDMMLTEVHRHARESGILRMATDVRLSGGYSYRPQEYGDDVRILQRGEIDRDEMRRIALETDQVLVGKNKTRHDANRRCRALRGIESSLPIEGDKVVCLRNNHQAGLLNGSLWRVHESAHDMDELVVDMVISSDEDGGSGVAVSSWAHHFIDREPELKAMGWTKQDREEFDYGYALTVHKAQGSQWEDVVLFDESHVFRHESRRWLYTGITRAAKQLTVLT